jgi:hypothetical protein
MGGGVSLNMYVHLISSITFILMLDKIFHVRFIKHEIMAHDIVCNLQSSLH